jgi:outer membrane protein assembly factor BamB
MSGMHGLFWRARAGRWGALALAAGVLAGCSVFEGEDRLPGERLPVRAQEAGADAAGLREERPLPAPRTLAAWTQTNANPAHNGGHVAGPGRPAVAWTGDAGTGSSDDSAVTAAPVVAEGRVFTLDAAAEIAAFDAASGAERWRTSLVPNEEEEGEEGFGGGLALAEGRLVITTGFGEVLALDPASGEVFWRRQLGAPMRAGPAVSEGLIVAVTRDSRAFGLALADGAVLWRHQGVEARAGFLGGASPALAGGLAFVPYPSGELVALEARTGRQVWGAVMTGGRRGLARSAITDLTGDPVVAGPLVIAANQSGRIAAFEGSTGQRAWTRAIGATRPIWAAGDSLFLVSDTARAMRLDARSGRTLWERALPAFGDPEDREDPIAYSGPVLVGGRALLTDSEGNLWSLDGTTGEGEIVADLPAGAVTGLVAASGTLYTLTDDADLVALR